MFTHRLIFNDYFFDKIIMIFHLFDISLKNDASKN